MDKKGSAQWNDTQRLVLIIAVKGQLDIGKTAENGLKKEAWTAILKEFNEATKCQYTKAQLQSLLATLKGKYQVFKDLKDNSGFGWDSVLLIPTAPPDVWDTYLAAHPKAKPYKTQTLPHFDDLFEIFEEKLASGRYATASTVPSATIPTPT